MGILKNLFKKNCSCEKEQEKEFVKGEGNLNIKILGTGCRNCVTLTENVKKALNELKINANVEKITDFQKISSYGIMSIPGLVVNEKIVSCGKVLKQEDIQKILREYTGEDL